MKHIADLLLEACFLKHIPRTGYQYLGVGRESVAEHVYSTTFIAFIMSQLEPQADAQRLIAMCLVHDLPETRIGDLNYVQRYYVKADEGRAVADALKEIDFGSNIIDLINEFNTQQTLEAQLAHDADQLALVIELKLLDEQGYQRPQTWLPRVESRLKTKIGKQLAKSILAANGDRWWRKLFH